MAELVHCISCGASLRRVAQWCDQCSIAIPPVTAEEPTLRRSFEEQRQLALPPQYTRWRKTDTTFGPAGRLLWTVAMVAIAAVFARNGNPFAFIPWCFVVMPLVLRSVWGRGRVTP